MFENRIRTVLNSEGTYLDKPVQVRTHNRQRECIVPSTAKLTYPNRPFHGRGR